MTRCCPASCGGCAAAARSPTRRGAGSRRGRATCSRRPKSRARCTTTSCWPSCARGSPSRWRRTRSRASARTTPSFRRWPPRGTSCCRRWCCSRSRPRTWRSGCWPPRPAYSRARAASCACTRRATTSSTWRRCARCWRTRPWPRACSTARRRTTSCSPLRARGCCRRRCCLSRRWASCTTRRTSWRRGCEPCQCDCHVMSRVCDTGTNTVEPAWQGLDVVMGDAVRELYQSRARGLHVRCAAGCEGGNECWPYTLAAKSSMHSNIACVVVVSMQMLLSMTATASKWRLL
mmetsp:Transcript_35311/g.89377  ORF Transcript_35311/g.89377 Transcript_35311/m.89377 type:complete len:290 (-) Transcript_35311:113-982(-)